MVSGVRLGCLLAAAVGLAGCGPRETVYQLKLITTACATPSPMEGVTHFLFRISGDGIAAPIEVTSLATARQLTLPPIPVGKNRVVEVRAFNGEPRGGVLVSLGRTLAFEVPEVPLALSQDLTVFLRPKSSLMPVSLSISPQSCSRMGWPHAGHTATVLRDGKVMIAGGYELDGAGARVASIHAELFDPTTGGFSDLPDLAYPDAQQQPVQSPRAFHTGTAVDLGRKVLLAGGETYAAGAAQPLGDALLYDPQARTYQLVPMNAARTQHGAALDNGGRVLLVGGYGTGKAFADTLEWFDAARTLFTPVPVLSLGRVQMGVSAVQSGQYIAVAGGSSGTGVSTEVRLYTFFSGSGTNTYSLLTTQQMLEPRRSLALAVVGDPARLVALGGYGTLSEAPLAPLASTEVIATAPQFQVSSGPNITIARGDACAVSLADGRVLVSGGRAPNFNQVSHSMDNVELVVQPSSGGPPSVLGLPSLPAPRYWHTCTALPDGTVLLTGGVNEQESGMEILKDAYIFTPAPLD